MIYIIAGNCEQAFEFARILKLHHTQFRYISKSCQLLGVKKENNEFICTGTWYDLPQIDDILEILNDILGVKNGTIESTFS
jgi:hypothetical protein